MLAFTAFNLFVEVDLAGEVVVRNEGENEVKRENTESKCSKAPYPLKVISYILVIYLVLTFPMKVVTENPKTDPNGDAVCMAESIMVLYFWIPNWSHQVGK